MNEQSNEKKNQQPVKMVMDHLRNMITNGELAPGDTLPSERKLAEELNVGRLTIRDAIKRLEFYGMVKTEPQSGTKIKGSGLLAFESLMTEILNFEEADFASMAETRNLLEIKSAGMAALKRTDADIVLIQKALKAFEDKIAQGDSAKEEDFRLHLQIAEVGGNSVLKLLMKIITPDVMQKNRNQSLIKKGRKKALLKEHRDIVDKIIEQDAKGAKNAMRVHLRGISKSTKKKSKKKD